MLYIQQKTGKFAELARQAQQAVKNGDIDTAEKIYQSVTGKTFLDHNHSVESPWMRYCMPDRISCYHDIDMSDVQYNGCDDRLYYKILKHRAEQCYGGTWEIMYEY